MENYFAWIFETKWKNVSHLMADDLIQLCLMGIEMKISEPNVSHCNQYDCFKIPELYLSKLNMQSGYYSTGTHVESTQRKLRNELISDSPGLQNPTQKYKGNRWIPVTEGQ